MLHGGLDIPYAILLSRFLGYKIKFVSNICVGKVQVANVIGEKNETVFLASSSKIPGPRIS